MPGLLLNFSITNAGYYEGVLFIRQGVNIPELAGGHRVVLNGDQLNLARSIYPLILSVNKKNIQTIKTNTDGKLDYINFRCFYLNINKGTILRGLHLSLSFFFCYSRLEIIGAFEYASIGIYLCFLTR